jgi:inosine/xanthosine triphosphate pyrophosphatase family protein
MGSEIMTKPQIKEYNCETGIETIKDATAAEIKQIELDAVETAARKAEAKAKATAKAAILDRIGLTADELKTILG